MFQRLNQRLSRLPGNRYGQRWSINGTMTLKASDGDVYLFRRRLIQTPLLAVYLHDILEADEVVDNLHSHPFSFIAFVLRGGYTERVGRSAGTALVDERMVTHKRWGVNPFPRGAKKVHTIVECDPRTKTLVFAGRRKDSWGWHVDGEGIVHWKEFLLREGRQARDVRTVEKPR